MGMPASAGGMTGRAGRLPAQLLRPYAVAVWMLCALLVSALLWGQGPPGAGALELTAAERALVGKVDPGLAAKITFDSSHDQYVFNAGGKASDKNFPRGAAQALVGSSSKKTNGPYSVDLPVDPKSGFTYYDNTLKLSFTAIPQFAMGHAQEIDGRIVYPLPDGGMVVYTVKNNGLKEDIVLTTPTDTQTYPYHLLLPPTLEARTIPGTGSIGIYSADKAFFENLSAADSAEQAKVIAARTKSPKSNLVFAFPPPLIKQDHPRPTNGTGNVRYAYRNANLDVIGEGMRNLAYPISVDPSVVVNTTAGFDAGNNEDDIDFPPTAPANQINRGGLTGGVSGSWTTSANALPVAQFDSATVAYNGHLYLLGGSGPVSAVTYAAINSDGSVGTWATTSPLKTSTEFEGAAAYDGYLYAVGGTISGSATVQYAPINADGTLGTWASTVNLLFPATRAGTAVANGHIYEVGGLSGGGTSANVQYASLQADGTVGAWATTTSLTAPTTDASAVAYGGYIYVVGGCSPSDGCATGVATVLYAHLNADGTVGTWTTTTALPNAITESTAFAYDGYLYNVGGCTSTCSGAGTDVATVDYAPIYANGAIGSWAAAASMPLSDTFASATAYNGYLYDVGISATTSIDYAPIQPAGYVGSWNTTNPLPFGFDGSTTVVYNGYVYELGGYSTAQGGKVTTKTYYAAISSDGTLGSWTATTALPAATEWASGVAYDGYLYEIGGYDGSSLYSNSVYYTSIGSNGALGASWTSTGPLQVALSESAAVEYNGYAYLIGGTNALGDVSTVYYGALSTSGGVSSWVTATTALSSATRDASAVVNGGQIYLLCGNGAATYNKVQTATIASDGSLGTWSTTGGTVPNCGGAGSTSQLAGAAVSGGYLYSLGGEAGTSATASVSMAPISASGSVGTWTATTPLPVNDSCAGSFAYGGYVYEVGGLDTCLVSHSPGTTVYYAPLENGGAGGVNSWTAATNLPVAKTVGAATYGGYIYALSGDDTNVNYAPIQSNGSLGSWTTSAYPLPGTNPIQAGVAYNGYLYSSDANGTFYSAINSDGSIGPWTTTASSAIPKFAYNGYMYDVGDTTSWYSHINSDGSLGTWSTTANPGVAVHLYAAAVSYGGYAYAIGGCSSSCTGTGLLAQVYYAPLNADGTVGTWASTTSLQIPTYSASAVASDGYLYAIGGQTTSGTIIGTVERAPIGSDGKLGTWEMTSPLPTALTATSAASAGGYVYELGGSLAGGVRTTNAYYAPLSVQARIGHYSHLVDLGVANATLTTISYTGTLPNGLGAVSYETAGSNGVFSSSALASSLTGANGASNIRYVWLYFTLDDSRVGGFPDSASTNNANVTSFTVNYTTVATCTHPAPTSRLRGGQSFSNNVVQPLDTCYP